MNSDVSADGSATSIAPNADLVLVKAFDENGNGTYVDVSSGLNWLLKNHEQYNIHVLNLSFSAKSQSYQWDERINQAAIAGINKGVYDVVKEIGTRPAEGTVIKAEGKRVWLNIGDDGVDIGDRLSLMTEGEAILANGSETGSAIKEAHRCEL